MRLKLAAAAAALLLPAVTAATRAVAATPPLLPADPAGTSVVLASPPSPHWVWVNDVVFNHMPDGQAILVDGDSGRMLGMLNTGNMFARVVLSADRKLIFSPETYFSRGTRGTRTDVVTIYDAAKLAPLSEIVIPPKRAAIMPMMAANDLTDDGRFLLIYNFTPSQSVSVVDMQQRRFAGEIETSGCALVYPTGPRSFFSICADGAFLEEQLTDSGTLAHSQRTAKLFDAVHDPLTEKPVRVGDTWYFVSFSGQIQPVTRTGQGLRADPPWSLLQPVDAAQHWRPGGLQQLAAHAASNRLYAIMHQGDLATHKEPGPQVWVYDLATHKRIQRIMLKNPAGSIQVSRDAQPLLFATFIGSTTLDIYDGLDGRHLRSVTELGTTPTVMVTP
ncbi:MAG: amine dehydrogenase [Proteobacteria bacterium]|nr:amine dehydrogenase [Pseudomonadota bacterium]